MCSCILSIATLYHAILYTCECLTVSHCINTVDTTPTQTSIAVPSTNGAELSINDPTDKLDYNWD